MTRTVGIDLSKKVFRLVEIRQHRFRKSRLRLYRYSEERLKDPVIEEGKVTDKDAAVTHLKNLLDKAYGRRVTRGVVASLPETKAFVKVVKVIHPEDAGDIDQAVMSEAELHIPSPLSDLYVDWSILNEKKNVAPGKPLKIILAAAPRKIVDVYADMLESAGLVPVAFEIEAQAIARSVLPAAEEQGEKAYGIIDFGATRSSFIVYHKGTIQFTVSIPLSGDLVTERIAKELGISMEEAERTKRQCGVDAHRCGMKMWDIMQPFLAEMAQRVRDAVSFYQDHFDDGKKLDEIILCGGGANMLRMDELLSELTGTTVRRADPWTNIDPNKCPLPQEIILSSTTAVGLALRSAMGTRIFSRRL